MADAITRLELVVLPERCVARDCPLLRYEWHGGRESMRCHAGVWGMTIDVAEYDFVRENHKGFGGVPISGRPLYYCPVSDEETIPEDNE